MRRYKFGPDRSVSSERRRILLTGAASFAALVASPFSCTASPVKNADGRGRSAGADGTRVAVGQGACNQCAQEVASGQRASYQQCYLFNPAYEGSSICQTCGHSWSYHA